MERLEDTWTALKADALGVLPMFPVDRLWTCAFAFMRKKMRFSLWVNTNWKDRPFRQLCFPVWAAPKKFFSVEFHALSSQKFTIKNSLNCHKKFTNATTLNCFKSILQCHHRKLLHQINDCFQNETETCLRKFAPFGILVWFRLIGIRQFRFWIGLRMRIGIIFLWWIINNH